MGGARAAGVLVAEDVGCARTELGARIGRAPRGVGLVGRHKRPTGRQRCLVGEAGEALAVTGGSQVSGRIIDIVHHDGATA